MHSQITIHWPFLLRASRLSVHLIFFCFIRLWTVYWRKCPPKTTKNAARTRGTFVIDPFGPDHPGSTRRSSAYLIIFLKWLNMVLDPDKTKHVRWDEGQKGHWPWFFIIYSDAVSACGARAPPFSARRPVEAARAVSYGGRRRATGV